MQGSQGDEGISFRALRTLLENENAESRSTEVTLSVLEIYRENVYDLLSDAPPVGDNTRVAEGKSCEEKLDIRVASGGVYVAGLSQHTMTSLAQATELLHTAACARAKTKTDMNDVSSRSLCVVTVCVTNTKAVTGQRATGKQQQQQQQQQQHHSCAGKLHLVDLAGCERIEKSGATGDTMKVGWEVSLEGDGGMCLTSITLHASPITHHPSSITHHPSPITNSPVRRPSPSTAASALSATSLQLWRKNQNTYHTGLCSQ